MAIQYGASRQQHPRLEELQHLFAAAQKEGLLGHVLRVLIRRQHPIAVGQQLAAEALSEQREPSGVIGAGRFDELGLVGAERTPGSI